VLIALAVVTLHGYIASFVSKDLHNLLDAMVYATASVLLWEAGERAWRAMDRATAKSRAWRRVDPGPTGPS